MRHRLVLLLGVTLLAVPAAARAAPRFTPCAGEIPGECARVRVPLDRTGTTPGSVSLLVRRTLTGERPSRRAVLALAGGPGQSAVQAFGEGYVGALGPLLAGRDFLALDVRGTGGSGALRCPGLDRATPERRAAAGAACARRLGPRRAFYTTHDTVDDIEAVRAALGIPRLTLFGVSYGTKVALAYAAAHPHHVERLLLDSVLAPEGPDPLYRPSFAALRRVAPVLHRGLGAQLRVLARRLRVAPLRGRVVGADGRARSGHLDEAELFALILDGDELPVLRSDLPAAVTAALGHDPTPLLRLANPDLASREHGRGAGLEVGPGFSEALYAATSCEEMTFPWPRTLPISGRPAALRNALAAQAPGAFAPFGPAVPPRTDFLRVCARWPVASAPPALAWGPLPAVPALLLAGEDDLRTPLEQARAIATRLPLAGVLAVQATGHSVLAAGIRCVTRAVAAWARGRVAPARCRRRRPDPLAAAFPRRLTAVRPARGTAGRSGRTLAAVVRALDDVGEQRARFVDRAGGLRAGRFAVRRGALVLSRLTLVEGVSVSGTLRNARGRLRVGGRAAAPGRLVLGPRGRLTGTLGGRRLTAVLARRTVDDLAG